MSGLHIQDSLQHGVDRVFSYLPQVLGALVILLIGHIIAKILEGLSRKALETVRFENALNAAPAGKYISRFIESPSRLISKIVYWLLFLLAISFAVSVLNLPALNNIVTSVYAYVPKVIAAVLIFLVASAVTAGADKFVRRVLGGGPMAQLIGAVLPAITMSTAIFMILNQLQIAKDIVNITFTAIMGSLALGLALAFGLGGRDIANKILNQAYESMQNNRGSTLTAAARLKRRPGRGSV